MTGRKLGRFEIIREIGKGAMGVVYLAHDPKIDRRIAIKMISLPAGLSPDEARESGHRFVREARRPGSFKIPTSSPFTTGGKGIVAPTTRWKTTTGKRPKITPRPASL